MHKFTWAIVIITNSTNPRLSVRLQIQLKTCSLLLLKHLFIVINQSLNVFHILPTYFWQFPKRLHKKRKDFQQLPKPLHKKRKDFRQLPKPLQKKRKDFRQLPKPLRKKMKGFRQFPEPLRKKMKSFRQLPKATQQESWE